MAITSGKTLLLEFLFKICYLIGLFMNIAGLVTASANIRQIARPFCGISLALLLLSWHRRLGWVNTMYSCFVLFGLVCTVLGDLILAQPVKDYLDYTGFLVHEFGLLLFIAGVSMPSNPDAELMRSKRGKSSKTLLAIMKQAAYGRAAEENDIRVSPPLPWRPQRVMLPATITIACLVAWRVFGGDVENHDPRYIATACMATIQCILVWRALARVGYTAPLVTVASLRNTAVKHTLEWTEDDDFMSRPKSAVYIGDGLSLGQEEFDVALGDAVPKGLAELKKQRAERNSRQLSEEAAALESRWWQWCGVWGCVLMCVALLCLGYDRLWLDDDQSTDGYANNVATWLTYAYTVASWLGQTLLVSSVPCEIPKIATLDDPAVSPGPTEGQSLRVLILIPESGTFDIAEVAVTWYYLVKRGHAVVFATKAGYPGVKTDGLPLPFEPSLHGFGGCVITGKSCGCCRRRKLRSYSRSTSESSRRAGASKLERKRGCGDLLQCCWKGLVGDLLDFSAMGVGVGGPSPLVVALFRELVDDPTFSHPVAYDAEALGRSAAKLPAKTKRKVRRERGFYSSSNDSAAAEYAEYVCTPESYDGMVVVGSHPSVDRATCWDDIALQEAVRRFAATGRPLGCIGNSQILLTKLTTNARPLCHTNMVTAIPRYMEVTMSLLLALFSCQWRPLQRLACGRQQSTQAKMENSLEVSAKFVPGHNPFSLSALVAAFVKGESRLIREANPHDDTHNVVVDDGNFVTAQCGGDAFVFVRRFANKLEQLQRIF